MRTGVRSRICLMILAALISGAHAQSAPSERTFPQSTAIVQKALKDLQSSAAGRLPVLDGFVVPGNRALDRFQRAYYQCTLQTKANPSGGTVVQVSVKITAWYNDADASKSGYQVLPSNGRLESDFLDRLADALATPSPSNAASVAPAKSAPPQPAKPVSPTPTLSAPMPQNSIPSDAIAAAKNSAPPPVSGFKVGAPDKEEAESTATKTAVVGKQNEALRTEATNLEEILRNQSHPHNLAAVRKAGTPVVSTPSEGAKVLFLAAAEDEFEILDMNANWVHVRISGINRGWIRRSSLELPDEFAAEPPPAPAKAPAAVATAATPSGPPFEVEHEEIASFPGDWSYLRGKTVKIVTVQDVPGHSTGSGSQAKLQFTKSLFGKEFAELTKNSSTAVGVVVMFDSVDGGMIATTLSVLQLWKNGDLSDEGMWRRCYFDPPELYNNSPRQ